MPRTDIKAELQNFANLVQPKLQALGKNIQAAKAIQAEKATQFATATAAITKKITGAEELYSTLMKHLTSADSKDAKIDINRAKSFSPAQIQNVLNIADIDSTTSGISTALRGLFDVLTQITKLQNAADKIQSWLQALKDAINAAKSIQKAKATQFADATAVFTQEITPAEEIYKTLVPNIATLGDSKDTKIDIKSAGNIFTLEQIKNARRMILDSDVNESAISASLDDISTTIKQVINTIEPPLDPKTQEKILDAIIKKTKHDGRYQFLGLKYDDAVTTINHIVLPAVFSPTVNDIDLTKVFLQLPDKTRVDLSTYISNYHKSIAGDGRTMKFLDEKAAGLKTQLRSAVVMVPGDQKTLHEKVDAKQFVAMGEYKIEFQGSLEGDSLNLYYRLALVPHFDKQGKLEFFTLLEGQKISNRYVRGSQTELAVDARMRATEVADEKINQLSEATYLELLHAGVLLLTIPVAVTENKSAELYKRYLTRTFSECRERVSKGAPTVLSRGGIPQRYALTEATAATVKTRAISLRGDYSLQTDLIDAVWLNPMIVNGTDSSLLITDEKRAQYADHVLSLARPRAVKTFNSIMKNLTVSRSPASILPASVASAQPLRPFRIFNLVDITQDAKDIELCNLAKTVLGFKLYCIEVIKLQEVCEKEHKIPKTERCMKAIEFLGFLSAEAQISGWLKTEEFMCQAVAPGVRLPVAQCAEKADYLIQKMLNFFAGLNAKAQELTTDGKLEKDFFMDTLTSLISSGLIQEFNTFMREAEVIVTLLLTMTPDGEQCPVASAEIDAKQDSGANAISDKPRKEAETFKTQLLPKILGAGFVRRPMMIKTDRTVCECCGTEVSGWRPWDIPWLYHDIARHLEHIDIFKDPLKMLQDPIIVAWGESNKWLAPIVQVVYDTIKSFQLELANNNILVGSAAPVRVHALPPVPMTAVGNLLPPASVLQVPNQGVAAAASSEPAASNKIKAVKELKR